MLELSAVGHISPAYSSMLGATESNRDQHTTVLLLCRMSLSLDSFHIHTRRGNAPEPCRFRYWAILVMTVSYQYISRDIVPAGVDVGMTLAWWNMYLSLPYVVPTAGVWTAENTAVRTSRETRVRGLGSCTT